MRGAGSITFVAGGVLVLAAWAAAATALPTPYSALTAVLAEPLALLLIVLAWRFRRSRLAISATIVGLANLLLRGPLAPQSGETTSLDLSLLAFLFALNLGVVVLLRDHPLAHPRTLVHAAAVLVQLPVAAGLLHTVGRSISASAPLAPAVVWVLVAGALAFLGDRSVHGAPLLMSAAQLTLLFALVEDSYRLAYHDGLTGLPGRRAFDEAMRLLDGDHTIAMVDIDHFKRFNDRHGHEAGDQVLRMVADELSRVGGGGRAYRYGGEEFVVLFPGVPVADARDAIEQLRVAVAEREFSIRSPKRPRRKPDRPIRSAKPVQRTKLTISAGMAGRTLKNPDPGAVLRAADAALYRAKRGGRNRVVAQGVTARKRRTATRGSKASRV
jgi:diguanylate cyclase (GGDEF)-like protein